MRRRDLMRSGALLALATGAAALAPLDRVFSLGRLDDDEVARGSLRKCISLGGPGSLRVDGHPDDYRLWGNREFIRSSGTGWVKLWVSWFDLQQELDGAPESRAESWRQLNEAPRGEAWLRRLDGQVRAINDDGLRVIVTLFHAFPHWASGAKGRDPVSPRKPAEQKLPTDLSPDGPWGWFVAHLLARYRKGARRNSEGPRDDGDSEVAYGNPDGGWLDGLEICNEPNLLFWPQEDADRAVVQMVRSADRLSGALGGTAILAPGTSDFPDRRYRNERGLEATDWRRFTRQVLRGLNGFRPSVPLYWTHHNFQDVKHEDDPSRAEEVIAMLREIGWTSHLHPLWLTEGGYDLHPDEDEPHARERQARLIEQNFRRMRELGGIYVWTQHTISDKPDNDFKSGLRDDFVEGSGPGRPRPAWQVWKELPGSRVA